MPKRDKTHDMASTINTIYRPCVKIGVSEDGEAGDDWIVESGAQGLRSVDLSASLVLELPEKTKLMRIMDSGDIWYSRSLTTTFLETRMLACIRTILRKNLNLS